MHVVAQDSYVLVVSCFSHLLVALALVGWIIRHDLFSRPHFLRNYSFALHEVRLFFKKFFSERLGPQLAAVVVCSDGLVFVLRQLVLQIKFLEKHFEALVAAERHRFELPFVPPVNCE